MKTLLKLSITLVLLLTGAHTYAEVNTSEQAFKAMSKQQWKKAERIARDSKDAALLKIVLSRRYLDNSYKDNSFVEISKFLLKNPVWPQRGLLQIQAENLIDDKTKDKDIIALFSIYHPITPRGRIAYAYATQRANPSSPSLPTIAKRGWINGNFDTSSQKKYKNLFDKHLTKADHKKRMDKLLANYRVTEAKQSLQYLDDKAKRSFNAHIKLIKKPSNSRAIFRALPEEFYTAGVIYQYLENNKKKLNFTSSDKIKKLITKASNDKQYGDRIWLAQHYIAREYMDHKKYRDAYNVVSFHFAQDKINQSNAEFLAGWLALEQLKKPKTALKHFKKLHKIVRSPISRSRSLYWMGRTYEALGDGQTAQKLYKLAGKVYPYSFYGQLSLVEMGGGKVELPRPVDFTQHKIKTDSHIVRDKHQLFAATRLVSKYGHAVLAQTYISFAASKIKTLPEMYDLLSLLDQDKDTHSLHWLARQAAFKKMMITNHSYPLPYDKIKGLPVDLALVYSIMRQESAFDKGACSHASAKGLMQIIEPTASDIAHKIDGCYKEGALTTDELYNIKLGSHYLRSLLDRFNGSYILAIAAYNAGPDKVDMWIERFGDPRKLKKYRDVVNWIELIPYSETRNYVQRVIENLEVYRSLLYPHNKLQLKSRLVFSKCTK